MSAVEDLAPEIVALLGAFSHVTHEDDYLEDGTPLWRVVIDEKTVARFDGEDDHENEQAAMALRGRAEAHVAFLSSRAKSIQSIRDFADFLEANPEAPLPQGGYFIQHYPDAAEFDAAAVAMGDAKVEPSGNGFEVATRRFGPVTYKIQTDGRKDQRERLLAAREARVAAAETALGLADEGGAS